MHHRVINFFLFPIWIFLSDLDEKSERINIESNK